MVGLSENLLSFYLYILLGFIIARLLKENREKIRMIVTKVLITFISPIQIFLVLTTTDFQLSFGFIIQIIVLAIIIYITLIVTSYYYLKKKEIDNATLGSFLLLNTFPNVMFYTIPIVLAVFSEELTIVPVIFASTMLIIRGSVATYISTRLGIDKKMNFKETMVKLFTFPPFIAILLGSIVTSFSIPMPQEFLLLIKPSINTLASSASAILVGMILAGVIVTELKKYKSQIFQIMYFRYFLSFLIYMIFVYFLRFDTFQAEIRTILLVIVIGPPAVYNVVFAVFFKLEEKFAAISVATLTLTSLVLLPIVIKLGMYIF